MTFVPTEKTRRIFENAGLVLKQKVNGVQVIYDQNRVEALQLYSEDRDEPLCFEFKVYSTDPGFRSYTEPFGGSSDAILYFDNQAAVSVDDDRTRLHAQEYVSNANLKKPDSGPLKDVLSQKDRLLPPVFVIKIFAENNQGPLLKRWLQGNPLNYYVAFNARQTFWKYYLLGKLAKQKSYIFDPENRIEFESLGEAELAGERVALTFRSKQKIPLNERYDFRFQLREEASGGQQVLIQRLPVASINQTGKEVVAGQGMVVSEIYINS